VWRCEEAIPPAAWTSQRATALFKCLLGAARHRLSREQASELLWPEEAIGIIGSRCVGYATSRASGLRSAASRSRRTDGRAMMVVAHTRLMEQHMNAHVPRQAQSPRARGKNTSSRG
jgi:hypothetical protein